MTEQVQDGQTQPQEGQNATDENSKVQDGQEQKSAPKTSEGKTDGGKRVGDVEFTVPEEYKEEKWAQDLKAAEDVWSKLAGAQKLIGRKGIIKPDDHAPKEEWDAFYNAQGRPENVEGYEFKRTVEDLKDIPRNPEFDNKIKNMFHELGVSKELGETLTGKFEEIVYEFHKPNIEKQAQIDQEFERLTHDVFGENKQSAMEDFKEVMRDSLGNKAFLAQKLESMDNDQLLLTMVFAKNLHDKYVGENKVSVGDGSSGDLTGDLRTDFRTLSEKKMRIKLDTNLSKHVKDQKIAHLNSQIAKIGEKASEKGIDLFSS